MTHTDMTASTFICRACGATAHDVVLDLGAVPLANAFAEDAVTARDVTRYPLALVMCEACRLLQIRDEVDRELLFRNYLWVTATSAGARDHAEWLAPALWSRFGADRAAPPLLVEIASNDGFFLDFYRRAGFRVLGVDPSNLADEATARGLPTVRDFFGADCAARIRKEHGPIELIVARNVLGHSSELRDLVAGIQLLLAPEGTLVLEVPYAYRIREELQYEYIFHEHLSYFTVTALRNLLRDFGLRITAIHFVEMNGGSLLCEVRHATAGTPAADVELLAFEEFIKLSSAAGWQGFARAVSRQREEFRTLLDSLRQQGARVFAYGAAARFMTLLNYCGITDELIHAVGDANPRKQGLFCPGTGIPVVSPRQLLEQEPSHIVIGPWNFRDEIIGVLRGQFGYRNAFILPLPTPEIPLGITPE